MPLVMMCGLPSSGKSTLATKLANWMEKATTTTTTTDSALNVSLVSDSCFDKNKVFGDAGEEKEMRSNLKSQVHRLLTNDSLVILDSSNYIKGFRYELYCLAKSMKTTHLVLHSDVEGELCWQWNCKRKEATKDRGYERHVSNKKQLDALRFVCDDSYFFHFFFSFRFDAVVQRFEAPDPKNRWDRPLVTVRSDGEIPFQETFNALFTKAAPRPNKSTQSIPLNSTNYLYELDRQTQETVNRILEAQRLGIDEEISFPNAPETKLKLKSALSAAQLGRLRRQFILYSKTRPATDNICVLFVQYIVSTIT